MTVDLPPETIRALKLRAVLTNQSVKTLVASFLESGLGGRPQNQSDPVRMPEVEIADDGLPIARGCANAPAERMTYEQLVKLEQDQQSNEDLTRAGLLA